MSPLVSWMLLGFGAACVIGVVYAMRWVGRSINEEREAMELERLAAALRQRALDDAVVQSLFGVARHVIDLDLPPDQLAEKLKKLEEG